MNKGNESAFFEQLLNHSDSLDFQKVFRVILSRWYWLVGSLFFFGMICFLYLRLSTPEYVASINLKYLGKDSELDEIANKDPAFVSNGGSRDYLTEKYNIRSREVIESALLKLNNPFTFFRLKDFRTIDIYPVKPLLLKVAHFDPAQYQNGEFLLNPSHQLSYHSGTYKKEMTIVQGNTFTVPGLSFTIEKINLPDAFEVKFIYNNASIIARDFIRQIQVNEVEEGMPVVALSFKHPNKPFAKDFLERLLEAYQEYDLRQKQSSSDLTLRFIHEQVKVYAMALKEAAHELEIFKTKHSVLDINMAAAEISEKVQNMEQSKNESEIQKAYIAMLERNLGATFEQVNYLSVGLDGTTDPVLIALLEQFNSLVSRRKELLLKYSSSAPAIKNLDNELYKFRKQILDNIALQKQKNIEKIRRVNSNIGSLKKRFNQIPALEKSFIYLQSNFEVNRNIYALLLNKEIESSIVRAGMLPSFQVITLMEVDKTSPKSAQSITLSVFLGLLTGLSSIGMSRYFNKKFVGLNLIKNNDHVNFLGFIHRHSGHHTYDLNVLLSDRSVFAESVSALRTRLNFLKLDTNLHPQSGKQILITSEKSGEGKTFISVNLALSLTKTGKKVIVVGCDLRKSKLHFFFQDSNEKGLSSYLLDENTVRPIKKSVIKNLDYIPAGASPLYPAELIQAPLFEELLAYCRRHYDYVILDTAPLGLVSDNIPLVKESHIVIFILRWLYSDQESYKLPEQLANDFEIDKIQVVVNDFYPDNLYSPITSSATVYHGYTHDHYTYVEGGSSGSTRGALARLKKKLSVTAKI